MSSTHTDQLRNEWHEFEMGEKVAALKFQIKRFTNEDPN